MPPARTLLAPALQSFYRILPMAQDWSTHHAYGFWYYGKNNGTTVTVELQESRLPDSGPSGWVLVGSEEFEGIAGTSPQVGKWTHEIGNGFDQAITGWGNGEMEYYTAAPENSATDGSGSLVITANEIDPATTELECWYGACEYTSATSRSPGSRVLTSSERSCKATSSRKIQRTDRRRIRWCARHSCKFLKELKHNLHTIPDDCQEGLKELDSLLGKKLNWNVDILPLGD